MEIKENTFVCCYTKDNNWIRGIIRKVHPYGFFYTRYREDDKSWYNLLYSEIDHIDTLDEWKE